MDIAIHANGEMMFVARTRLEDATADWPATLKFEGKLCDAEVIHAIPRRMRADVAKLRYRNPVIVRYEMPKIPRGEVYE